MTRLLMKLRRDWEDSMQDCIFCKIANKEIEAPIKHEDDSFVIIPSKFPAAETHFLVIPKQHVQSIVHVDNTHAEMLGKMMVLASEFAKKQGIEDYKLIFNAGKYTQLPHLHLHILAGDLKDNT